MHAYLHSLEKCCHHKVHVAVLEHSIISYSRYLNKTNPELDIAETWMNRMCTEVEFSQMISRRSECLSALMMMSGELLLIICSALDKKSVLCIHCEEFAHCESRDHLNGSYGKKVNYSLYF